jgi:hypothetical protein
MAPKKISMSGMKVQSPVTIDDLKKLVVPSLGGAAIPTLQDLGYNGKAAAYVGLTLDLSNTTVVQGDVFLVGALYEDQNKVCAISGDKLWPGCPANVGLFFKFENLGIFQFRGKLASDFVPFESLSAEYMVDGSPVNRAAFMDAGGEDCCLRASLYPETGDFLRLNISVFPMARAVLLTRFPFPDNSGIPGMRLVDSVMIPLSPKTDKKWGLMWWPVLALGSRDNPLQSMLGDQIRRSIHLMMSKGVKPVGASGAESLLAKYAALDGATEALPSSLPFLWRVPTEFEEPSALDHQGKHSFLSNANLYLFLI